jgi:hypothetical protein
MNASPRLLPSNETRKVVMLMPKKKAFVQDLNFICEQMARLGYTRSIELEAGINAAFIE